MDELGGATSALEQRFLCVDIFLLLCGLLCHPKTSRFLRCAIHCCGGSTFVPSHFLPVLSPTLCFHLIPNGKKHGRPTQLARHGRKRKRALGVFIHETLPLYSTRKTRRGRWELLSLNPCRFTRHARREEDIGSFLSTYCLRTKHTVVQPRSHINGNARPPTQQMQGTDAFN